MGTGGCVRTRFFERGAGMGIWECRNIGGWMVRCLVGAVFCGGPGRCPGNGPGPDMEVRERIYLYTGTDICRGAGAGMGMGLKSATRNLQNEHKNMENG